VLELIQGGPLPVVAPVDPTKFCTSPPPALPRENPLDQPKDLAVPGMTLADVLNRRPQIPTDPNDVIGALTFLILGFPSPFAVPTAPPRSQVEQAAALQPTTVLLWAGNNDALFPELFGDISTLTPIQDFAATLNQIMNSLASTHAKIVLA